MDDILKCPICKEEVFSKAGRGCRMCGMALENELEEFCCIKCENKFEEINSKKINSGGNK